MLGMLLAYDSDGHVVGTLDYLVQYGDDGEPLGLVDFATHELDGGEMTDVWTVSNATGSKCWPEWLGSQAHAFRVVLTGPAGHKHIAALIHKTSGHRRERSALEAAIETRTAAADGQPADIRDLVGGPNRALRLDPDGRTLPWTKPGRTPPLVPSRHAHVDGL